MAGGGFIATSGHTTYEAVPNNTNPTWFKDPCLRINVMHCIGLCAASWMQGYDGSLFNGVQSIPAWLDFFDNPEGTRLGLMNATIFAPAIIATPLIEIVCSRFGRRPALRIGALITIAGAVVNAASKNFGMWIAGRVLLGFGTSCATVAGPILLQELAHPRYRAKIAGMFTSCQYTAGILSSWMCFGTLHLTGNKSWRIPCYFQILGPSCILLLTATIAESPRWLVSKGRLDQARTILARAHANGDENDPLVNLECEEIEAAIKEESEMPKKGYWDLFNNGPNRRRIAVAWTVAVGTNWVGNGVISYYLTPVLKSLGITKSIQTELINCGLQIWNLILSTGAAIWCERIGRRPLWLISTIGMLFSMSIVMGLSAGFANTGTQHIGTAVIPFLFIFFGFYDIAWTPLTYSYPIEIMPFEIRAKAVSAYIIVQNLALFANNMANSVALANIGWKYYGVFLGILIILIIIIYFYFPETKGLTVEEIGFIFETGRKGDRRLAADQLRSKAHALHKDGGKDGEVQHVENSPV